MTVYAELVEKIIKAQEAIIGPVAVEQARQVSGLHLDWGKGDVSIDGDEAGVVNNLVEIYKQLFGQISVEVSKEAAASLIGKLPSEQLPEALR